jgi:hypothetical protein
MKLALRLGSWMLILLQSQCSKPTMLQRSTMRVQRSFEASIAHREGNARNTVHPCMYIPAYASVRFIGLFGQTHCNSDYTSCCLFDLKAKVEIQLEITINIPMSR